MDHLIVGNHIPKEEAEEIEKKVLEHIRENPDYLLKVTPNKSEFDIFLEYYMSAMEGDKTEIKGLDQSKPMQYMHLFLLKNVLLQYVKDIVCDVETKKLKNRNLFGFGWGGSS